MIGAADHMGHAHVEIVHHNGQHIGGRAVRTQQHHVIKLIVGEAHIAQHQVLHDGFALIARLQPHHKRSAGRCFRGVAIAPASIIADGITRRPLCFAHLNQFVLRGVTAIGFALGQQRLGYFAMAGGAGELIDRFAVPIQAHPVHAVQDCAHGFGRGALPIGVLDAQQEGAAGMARIKPVEQSRTGAADMQHACGRGREAQDRFGVLGHGDARLANGFR